MLVKSSGCGVAEEDAAAAVGLETVFVGVDDDGIDLGQGVAGCAGGGFEICGEGEVAAIGAIGVEAEVVAIAEFEDLRQGVNGPEAGGPEGGYDAADINLVELAFEDFEVHATEGVHGDGLEGLFEDGTDTVVGVVGLFGGDGGFAGVGTSGDPEGFEIGHGAAAGEVAKVRRPAEHSGNFSYGLAFHSGTCFTAIEGVVVGIDPHGHGIRRSGDGVGRLEHLARVKRVEVGKVVVEAVRGVGEDAFHFGGGRVAGYGGEGFEALFQLIDTECQ